MTLAGAGVLPEPAVEPFRSSLKTAAGKGMTAFLVDAGSTSHPGASKYCRTACLIPYPTLDV